MDEVLAHYSLDRRLALLSSWTGRATADIRAAIWDSGFEDDSDRGKLSADEYLCGTAERLGYPLSAEEWVRARRESMTPNNAVLAAARRLSAHRTVAMFSNNGLLLEAPLLRSLSSRRRAVRRAGNLLG